jgi:collagen type IV alpha-3-binding protein
MEGTLLKWTNYISGYKERYFVLKNNVLYYYIQKGEKPKGRIHLSLANISSEDDNLRIDIETGITTIAIKAKDKTEKDEWLSNLKKAKFQSDNNNKVNKDEDNNFNNFIERTSITDDNKLIKKVSNMNNFLNKIKRNNDSLKEFINKNDPENVTLKNTLANYQVILININY